MLVYNVAPLFMIIRICMIITMSNQFMKGGKITFNLIISFFSNRHAIYKHRPKYVYLYIYI